MRQEWGGLGKGERFKERFNNTRKDCDLISTIVEQNILMRVIFRLFEIQQHKVFLVTEIQAPYTSPSPRKLPSPPPRPNPDVKQTRESIVY